jgi:hypothetical protein
MLALAQAEAITVVDEVLVNYRVGTGVSLQSTNHETPLEFYQALMGLRASLIESDRSVELERGFTNLALSHCLYNLKSLKQLDAFVDLYNKLKSGIFSDLGIEGHPESYFFSTTGYDCYRRIMEMSPEDYLFNQISTARDELASVKAEVHTLRDGLRRTQKKSAAIQGSRSYRIGHALTALPRVLRRAAKRIKGR